jgi:hypothetical protein
MHQVSTARSLALRGTFLLIAAMMGSIAWGALLREPSPTTLPLMHSVARCMLCGMTLLAVLGIRYPLRMLPLLLFDLAWKLIWLVAYGLPLWRGNAIDATNYETVKACLLGAVLFPLVIPWAYVWANYVRGKDEPLPWR